MDKWHNYQPVMIKTLLQKRASGRATKEEIKFQLHKNNPERTTEYFTNSPVFEVLTEEHPVALYDESKKEYQLLDFNTFSVAEKAVLVRFCNQKIKEAKLKEKKTNQYFIVQINRYGGKSFDKNQYENKEWKKSKKDSDHGMVKPGDYLLTYFSPEGPKNFNMLLARTLFPTPGAPTTITCLPALRCKRIRLTKSGFIAKLTSS